MKMIQQGLIPGMILLKNPRSRFALGAIKRCQYENSLAAGKLSAT
jgi:hypothetical protein